MCDKDCFKCGYEDCINDEFTPADRKELIETECMVGLISRKRVESYEKNKEKVKAYNKAYHAKNRDETNRKHREYYEVNKEAYKAKQRDYYAQNREKICANKREAYKRKKAEDINLIG